MPETPVRSLTVLGCDGSWAGPGGAGSGYLVRLGTTAIVLDLGPGTFAHLQRFGSPEQVDALVLTHRHADHWSDLASLAAWLVFAADTSRMLRVLAPAGLAEYTRLADSAALRWETVADGQQVEVGECALTFSRTDHPVETLAVRIDGADRSLGYSADSGPGWSLASLGPPLDLAVVEATFTQDREGTAGHLSGRHAGALARVAGARRLVLTHRWPTIDAAAVAAEARATFGADVEQAEILKEFTL